MNELLWDQAYNDFSQAMETGEPLKVGNVMMSFPAAVDHLMLDPSVQYVFQALMKQTGTHSVEAVRDHFKHTCAKAFANWMETLYEKV